MAAVTAVAMASRLPLLTNSRCSRPIFSSQRSNTLMSSSPTTLMRETSSGCKQKMEGNQPLLHRSIHYVGVTHLDEAVFANGVDADDELTLHFRQLITRSHAILGISWIKNATVLVVQRLIPKWQRDVSAKFGDAKKFASLLSHCVLHYQRRHFGCWLWRLWLCSFFRFFSSYRQYMLKKIREKY